MTIDSVSVLVAAWFSGVLIGYAIARLDGIGRYLRNSSNGGLQLEMRQPSFFEKNKAAAPVAGMKAPKIDIDTSKVVTEISTAGIKKGSEVELGTTTAKQDTLNESVSKLAQLKGR